MLVIKNRWILHNNENVQMSQDMFLKVNSITELSAQDAENIFRHFSMVTDSLYLAHIKTEMLFYC